MSLRSGWGGLGRGWLKIDHSHTGATHPQKNTRAHNTKRAATLKSINRTYFGLFGAPGIFVIPVV